MIFLNRLITKIKFLFVSKEEKSNWHDLSLEELKNEDIKTKQLNINYSLFKSLRPYDIVLVKMNEHAIRDRSADSSHFTRPFLITEKYENGSFKGYYMTGSTNTNYY